MARLDICLASKIINNELFYDVTEDGFFSITIPEKNVKYYSNCIYFENICFYIQNRAKMPNSLYTIYNAYNTNTNNIQDNTLSINQLVLLLKNTNPNKKYNNLVNVNTSSFIVNIK
jgi:hypothetical protein